MNHSDGYTRRRFLIGSTLGLSSIGGGLWYRRATYVDPVRRAPELIGAPSQWLNTAGSAVRLYGGAGVLERSSAVLVDFFEYTCVNCLRTVPYLREWDRRYRGLGLTILGIHTPEFAFARNRDNVAAAVERLGLTYPIVVDSQYENWNAYRNEAWPAHYLIDPGGRILDVHEGEGGYGATEERIQGILKRSHPFTALPKPMEPVRGADRPGAVCYRQTPEVYAGYRHGVPFFASPGGYLRGRLHTYSDDVSPARDGAFYANGVWLALPESMRYARSTTDPMTDSIRLPYMALQANAVIRPEDGRALDVFLEQDGKPIIPPDRGADVRYAPDGRSYVHVEAPRMYELISNRKWGKHELRLGSASPGFGLYSFSFASCQVGGQS